MGAKGTLLYSSFFIAGSIIETRLEHSRTGREKRDLLQSTIVLVRHVQVAPLLQTMPSLVPNSLQFHHRIEGLLA
jgi:hypothetical protein